jgi:hypothetical protein
MTPNFATTTTRELKMLAPIPRTSRISRVLRQKVVQARELVQRGDLDGAQAAFERLRQQFPEHPAPVLFLIFPSLLVSNRLSERGRSV